MINIRSINFLKEVFDGRNVELNNKQLLFLAKKCDSIDKYMEDVSAFGIESEVEYDVLTKHNIVSISILSKYISTDNDGILIDVLRDSTSVSFTQAYNNGVKITIKYSLEN